ncbi:MAG: hypothetical protein JSS82_10850 [Bacteroidetes bacterium]|nr:hypothetical protein [Bacteroidota bacterium]
MDYFAANIIPSLQAFQLLSDTNKFKQWTITTHKNINPDELFQGYKFCLLNCLNAFIDAIQSDHLLEINNDFILDRAISHVIPIEHLENSCEKIIFLKNLKIYTKPIVKAKSFEELEIAAVTFNDKVGEIFTRIINSCVEIKPKVSIPKEVALEISLIDFLQTYLTQMSREGPMVNWRNVLSVNHITAKQLEIYFVGYKYGLQFLWNIVLGNEQFLSTSLKNMHTASSWKTYVYAEPEKESIDEILLGRKYDLDVQNSLDSYFFRITNEITNPLDRKYKTPTFNIGSIYRFNAKNYDKSFFFGALLTVSDKITKPTRLTLEDEIEKMLYWYSYHSVESSSALLYSGTSSFLIMLAGSVELHDVNSEFSKVIIGRFIHPLPNDPGKNDFSYGILIDSKSAAGHHYNGWLIYTDICGNYSGFSGSLYNKTEEQIRKYLDSDEIEVRELTLPLDKFQEFLNRHKLPEDVIFSQSISHKVSDVIQKARAYVFELFVFQLFAQSKRHRDNGFTVTVNSKIEEREIDILLDKPDEAILIECKITPDNYDLTEVINKLNENVAALSKLKDKVSYELWFWNIPSTQSQQILNLHNIQPVIVSTDKQGNFLLKSVDLSRLNFIMKDTIK